MDTKPRIESLGDSAISLEFGDTIDPVINARVMALYGVLEAMRQNGDLNGVVELVPSFRALAVHYDPLVVPRADLVRNLVNYLEVDDAAAVTGALWELPACYEADYAPDIAEIAERAEITVDEVVRLHTTADLKVYILGFVPGFAYLGGVPEILQFPRRTVPRTSLPAGSVAIAGDISAVYPIESPGGWHLIGRCPVPMFDPYSSPPTFLSPGDRVRFRAISAVDYEALAAQVCAGEFDVQTLRQGA